LGANPTNITAVELFRKYFTFVQKDRDNGLPIDDTAFIKIWQKILVICGIDYRSPYQLGHTGISMALHHGANPIELAEMTGHDKRVMLSTYSHAINQDCLFVDFGGQ
jgi:integrase